MSAKWATRFVFTCGYLVLLTSFSRAQITVEGKALDSSNKSVGGVDVATYVPGKKDPVSCQKSNDKTGEYRFSNLQLPA